MWARNERVINESRRRKIQKRKGKGKGNAHVLHNVGPHVLREGPLHSAGEEAVDKVVGLQRVLPFQVHTEEVGYGDLELLRGGVGGGVSDDAVAINRSTTCVGRAGKSDKRTFC